MIMKFDQYLIEGLIKTYNIDLLLSKEKIFLSNLKIFYKITKKTNNTLEFELDNFNKISNICDVFDCIESFFINMMGWFPSQMKVINSAGMSNVFPYNDGYLKTNINYIQTATITFESKFDIEQNVPMKLYHLSIEQFYPFIKKNGLSPKQKSKLIYHPNRIYVCDDINSCKSLIPQMKMFYNSKKWSNVNLKIKDKWIIYEIDTNNLDLKLYQDPNYNNGYYILNCIPTTNIKIIDKE